MKIGIMGVGHYGKLLRRLIRRFTDDVDVVMYDKHRLVHGVHYSVLEVFEDCDAIIFAVPMEQLEPAVRDVLTLPNLRKNTIFVNVCSDQTKSGETMAQLCEEHPYICVHSPWGPEAYRVVGEVVSLLPPIVVTKWSVPEGVWPKIGDFVREQGFKIDYESPEKHDEQLAGRWMYLAHLITQIFEQMGVFAEDCSAAPISFQKIVEGARLLRNDKDLFLDLWSRVPACHGTFEQFLAVTHQLASEKEIHANGK